MQGKQTVIDALNAGLTIELTAINQYFVQSKMCKNWGLNKLAAKHYDTLHPLSPFRRDEHDSTRLPRHPSCNT